MPPESNEKISELAREVDKRLGTVTATLDQLQAELDRRDDALLDLVAVLALAAIATLFANHWLRTGSA